MLYTCKPRKFGLYVNSWPYKTMAQVKAETGCDIICNGYLFDMSSMRACCNIKSNGVVLNKEPYAYVGYAWNEGEMPIMTSDFAAKDNFISCVCLVNNGKAQEMYYNSQLGGSRGRTAIGFKADGSFVLWCAKDGADSKTMEQLQQLMLDAGCVTALALDGGGSSSCITPETAITTTRTITSFVCVWEDKGEETPEETEDTPMAKHIVCVDAGHGGSDNCNGSPDGTYKEHKFTLDVAQRLASYLKSAGVGVILTRDEDESVSLASRAAIANAGGADLFVSLHSNAAGTASTDAEGWSSAKGLSVYTYGAGAALGRNIAANKILDAMREENITIHGGGLNHAKFTVLAQTNMPAVLIEYGFHTSKEEVALLKSEIYRDQLAYNTAKGICDYFGIAAPEHLVCDRAEPEEDAKDNTPAAWEKEAVEWAIVSGIIAGDENGDYALHSTVTKAQVACMIYRALNN